MEKRSRFARPDVTVLKLANGDTLTVKRRLTAGEQRAMFARMYHSVNGSLKVNTLQVGAATCLAYLLDWTLTDDDGQLVEIRGMAPDDLAVVLDSLTPEDFKEISQAIDAHSTAMEDARDQEKKTAPGAAASSSISDSPVSSAGGTNGSGT
jgi:hypothetical protein